MEHATPLGPCDELPCWTLPPEFVRMRFYYGQPLGVVDFYDWLAYHMGKQRFHNVHGHGAGVLCGLRAERFVPAQSPNPERTTLLRVRSGAALDACGREIVVGVDQCIDVDAWLRQHGAEERIADWCAGDDPRLYVGLRYLECPSDPMPAPRDPCGCDAGGCEYGRVREGFEMRLFTPAEMAAVPPPRVFPAVVSLGARLEALGEEAGVSAAGTSALRRALAELAAADCPATPEEPWLWLACFEVVFENGQAVDLVALDSAIPERATLLGTAALQELLLALAAENGVLAPGPRVGGLRFDGPSGGDAELFLDVELAPDPGAAGASVPLHEGTFDGAHVSVHRLRDTGWDQVDDQTSAIELDAAGPHVRAVWPSGVLEAGRYRVTLAAPPETPIVDERMRPLQPAVFARSFELVDDGSGNLTLAGSPS